MNITWSAFFQFVGPAVDVAVLGILVQKGRLRRFPAFAAYTTIDLIFTLILNLFYSRVSPSTYEACFFVFDLVSVVARLALIWELATSVIRPAGRWIPEARKRFIMLAALGAVAAITAAILLVPRQDDNFNMAVEYFDVFGDLLMTELVVTMMLAASSFGLSWTNHVIAIGQGMMIITLLNGSLTIAQLSFALSDHMARLLDRGSRVAYLLTCLYWCVALWREEPARKPISPELRKYIVALHDQVQYDLGKVRH